MVRTRRARVVVVLFDDFETLDVALFSAVLDQAGRRWNHRAFDIELVAAVPGPVRGRPFSLDAAGDLDGATADVLFLPGGQEPAAGVVAALPEAIERAVRESPVVCATGNAQLRLFAAATPRPGAACARGALARALRELRPELPIDEHGEWIAAGDCLLGANSLSSIELGLEVVRRTLGVSEARTVADALGHRGRGPRLVFEP